MAVSFLGAHPRSRGENSGARSGLIRANGSSPLTRGKQDPYYDALDATRLIPAHAGKTHPGMPTARSRPAHPRSRGENETHPLIVPIVAGSSPLTRGKLPGKNDPCTRSGLIPAHAGKTGLGIPDGYGIPAHPRSRGENTAPPSGLSSDAGSSPLTRGKRVASP